MPGPVRRPGQRAPGPRRAQSFSTKTDATWWRPFRPPTQRPGVRGPGPARGCRPQSSRVQVRGRVLVDGVHPTYGLAVRLSVAVDQRGPAVRLPLETETARLAASGRTAVARSGLGCLIGCSHPTNLRHDTDRGPHALYRLRRARDPSRALHGSPRGVGGATEYPHPPCPGRRRAARHDAAARLRRRVREKGSAWCDWCLGRSDSRCRCHSCNSCLRWVEVCGHTGGHADGYLPDREGCRPTIPQGLPARRRRDGHRRGRDRRAPQRGLRGLLTPNSPTPRSPAVSSGRWAGLTCVRAFVVLDQKRAPGRDRRPCSWRPGTA